MSKYIEADAVEKAICKRVYAVEVEDILAEMANAPSIDIVRCKECRYAELYDGYYTQVCCQNGVIGGHGELWNPDDFCSYGEREGK